MLNKNLLKALLLASSVFALAACNKSDQAQDQQAPADQSQDQSADQSQDQAQDQSLGYDKDVFTLAKEITDGQSADDAAKADLVANNYAGVLEQVALLAKDSDGQKAIEALKADFVANKADQAHQAFAQAAAKVVSDVAAAAQDGKKVDGWNIPVADNDQVTYDQFKTDLLNNVKTQAATWAGDNKALLDEFNAAFDAFTANDQVAASQADDLTKAKALTEEVMLFLNSFGAYATMPDAESVRAAADAALNGFLTTYVQPLNLPQFAAAAPADQSQDQQAPADQSQDQQAPADQSQDQQQAPADQQQAPADNGEQKQGN